jgi:hypothetical protein
VASIIVFANTVGAIAGTLPAWANGVTERVSLGSAGRQGNCGSNAPSMSSNSLLIAFQSCASNLVDGDSRRFQDVLVRDRRTGRTELLSVGLNGRAGNGDSANPVISHDGRFVVFDSFAANLVLGDTNGASDVFIRDRQRHKTSRVSISSAGTQGDDGSGGSVISANARFVAFTSNAMNLVPDDFHPSNDVFVRDLQTGITERVSVGLRGAQPNGESNGGSGHVGISDDGRFIAFFSTATNLIADDRNDQQDAFVFDRATKTTTRVSLGINDQQANNESRDSIDISGNGRFVVFASDASNLVPNDTNGISDIFVYDLKRHKTARISIGNNEQQANNSSGLPAITKDGRFVGFASSASNLVRGDTNEAQDFFVRDRRNRVTRRVSVASGGRQANMYSYSGDISDDGRTVTFASDASNLVKGDTNSAVDVFLRRGLSYGN